MPIPVKSSCSTRSMETLGARNQTGLVDDEIAGRRQGRSPGGALRRYRIAHRPLPHREGPAARSIVKVDMLVVDDGALFVSHDVVAMQTVAILVEIIFALRAGIF